MCLIRRFLNLNNFLLRPPLDILSKDSRKLLFFLSQAAQKSHLWKIKILFIKSGTAVDVAVGYKKKKKNREKKTRKNSTNSTHNWEINIKLHLTGKFQFNSQSLQFFSRRWLQNPSTKDAIHCKSPTMMIFDFGWE